MPRNAIENDENPPVCLKLFKFLSYRAQGKRLLFANEKVSTFVPISIFKRNLTLSLSSGYMMMDFYLLQK